jgi:hypothetical protein
MNSLSFFRILKYFLYGYAQPFLIVQPIIAMVLAFAKMIGNPEAILTSTIAILSMAFGLIGAVAAIGAMPAVRSIEVDNWMSRRFVVLIKYQRDRNYPSLYFAEAIGIFLFFLMALRAENRVDPILSMQAIVLLSFIQIPIWKGIWTFLSFSVPAFLFRSFSASNKIKNLQNRFGVGFIGFKNRYRLRHSKKIFWSAAAASVFSFIASERLPFIDFIASALVGVAITLSILAVLGRIALDCPQVRESIVGRRAGVFACRWLLSTEP